MALAAAAYFLGFYPRGHARGGRVPARALHGRNTRAWAAEVPLFWPRLSAGGPRESRFEWGRVRANREWRTAAALPLVALLLHLRSRWPE